MSTFKKFWICPNCHDEVEDHFEVCWNCQHDRSGLWRSEFSGGDIEDHPEKAELSDKWRNKHCANCNKSLTYIGMTQVREGSDLGPLGDLVNLFPTYTKVHVYRCSACDRVEYFV